MTHHRPLADIHPSLHLNNIFTVIPSSESVARVRGTGSSDPAVVDSILRTGDRGIPNESRRHLEGIPKDSDLPFNLELINRSLFRREVDAQGNDLAAVGSVGIGIPLVLNLVQGFLCRTVELELDDIDVPGALHHTVYASLTRLLLRHGAVEGQHTDNEVEGVLEVALTLHRVLLALETVGDGGE